MSIVDRASLELRLTEWRGDFSTVDRQLGFPFADEESITRFVIDSKCLSAHSSLKFESARTSRGDQT